jgi:two-component system, NarL family, sensor kinase
MLNDSNYFSQLYQIASALNQEFSLKKALEKTVQLLGLETGWIWLMQGDGTVYLAASYNLPPALKEHPERLAGRCYCIEKYLSNHLDKARNISEITCTRLQNIRSGTRNLKFHATVPINISNQKVGLINLVSQESQQLDEKQLSVLSTISELMAIAIQRTQAQEAHPAHLSQAQTSLYELLDRVFKPRIEGVIASLSEAKYLLEHNLPGALESIRTSLSHTQQLSHQVSLVLDEVDGHNEVPAQTIGKVRNQSFHYPSSPLTERELEILTFVKKGYTNKQIAETLFISERTVKFHLTSILSKLFARTRTEAVNIALKRGLIGF